MTVVVPTYDRAAVLPRAIDSVLTGGYKTVDLRVVDDGSTDETRQVVESYDDDRLSYHRFETNRGANAARNRGIEAATGEYVAFLDSDDAYTDAYLERCVSALEQAPATFAGTYGSRVWYRDGGVWNLTVADSDVTHADLRRKNVVGGFSNVLVRRSVFERTGPLDEELASCQDYDFFLRLLEPAGAEFYAVPDAVVRYHVHDEGATRIGDDLEAGVAGRRRFLAKHGDTLTTTGTANQYYQFGMTHARAGNLGRARRWFRRGLRTNPRSWRHWYHFLASLGGRRTLHAAVALKVAVKRRLDAVRHDPPAPE
ncbi:MAG: glycosyltransferase family A protein [Haloarculaceae archaeon]